MLLGKPQSVLSSSWEEGVVGPGSAGLRIRTEIRNQRWERGVSAVPWLKAPRGFLLRPRCPSRPLSGSPQQKDTREPGSALESSRSFYFT